MFFFAFFDFHQFVFNGGVGTPPVYVSPHSPPTYFGSQIWGTVRYASFLKIFQKKFYKFSQTPF